MTAPATRVRRAIKPIGYAPHHSSRKGPHAAAPSLSSPRAPPEKKPQKQLIALLRIRLHVAKIYAFPVWPIARRSQDRFPQHAGLIGAMKRVLCGGFGVMKGV
jgi:hypothetical protein